MSISSPSFCAGARAAASPGRSSTAGQNSIGGDMSELLFSSVIARGSCEEAIRVASLLAGAGPYHEAGPDRCIVERSEPDRPRVQGSVCGSRVALNPTRGAGSPDRFATAWFPTCLTVARHRARCRSPTRQSRQKFCGDAGAATCWRTPDRHRLCREPNTAGCVVPRQGLRSAATLKSNPSMGAFDVRRARQRWSATT